MIKEIGHHVFERFLYERSEPLKVLKLDGVMYSDKPPIWFEHARLLSIYFCPIKEWGDDPNILALVQTARQDCLKRLNILRQRSKIEDSHEIGELTDLVKSFDDFLRIG